MSLFSVEIVLILLAITFVAGTVNGLAGFGFAVVGTMVLATVISPALAVVVMIVPILSANLTLLSELSTEQLTSCGRRFGPLVGSALVGTVAGMALLEVIPEAPLRVGLGLITLAFVASQQEAVALPEFGAGSGPSLETPGAMVAIGSVSGLLFGATNVGVQIVAYLRSRDLSHSLFVGVVAMVFVGINGVRVGAAGLLGLYPTLAVFGLSVLAAGPAVAGVAAGSRLRSRVRTQHRRWVVLGLLTLIGVRLLLGGLGIA